VSERTDTVTVTVVDHPLVVDALAQIRDKSTPNALFRQNLERIGTLLLAEATRSLPTVDTTVETPLTTAPARRLAVQPVVVPILRAGLGFVHAAQELLPDADVGFIGISRDEETFAPKPYVNKLPESLAGRPVIVIDPMLATGGSLVHTCELLVERGAPNPILVVCALCAPEGIDRLRESGLHLHVVTASIDDHLNESAFIVPGLGDAGDRQFGPPA
jgi:uracil phosphoribosyltransferase